MTFYAPDFEDQCYLCGTSPTVIVVGHVQPQTQLCGPHFFDNQAMVSWEDWNEVEKESDET